MPEMLAKLLSWYDKDVMEDARSRLVEADEVKKVDPRHR
jgi:hypothetical protein